MGVGLQIFDQNGVEIINIDENKGFPKIISIHTVDFAFRTNTGILIKKYINDASFGDAYRKYGNYFIYIQHRLKPLWGKPDLDSGYIWEYSPPQYRAKLRSDDVIEVAGYQAGGNYNFNEQIKLICGVI